jgi:hypothetical protein
MGDCRSNMKPTNPPASGAKDDGGFSIFKGRRKRDTSTTQQKATNFADNVEAAERKLQELIVQKETELKTETGQEVYNRNALSHLRTMHFHLEEIIFLAEAYSELKK